jgi:hypothetical protein
LFQEILAGGFTNVSQIKFCGVEFEPELPHSQLLADALTTSMPKLEFLEWVDVPSEGQGSGNAADDIVNLSGLTNVTTLRIDIYVVCLTEYFPTLEVSTAFLPPNLHTLHLSSVPLPKLDRALRRFSDGERASFVASIHPLALEYPLRSLTIALEPGYVLKVSRATVTLLQEAADSLYKLGTDFGVRQNAKYGETAASCLVGRWFVARELQLYDHVG